MEIVGAVVTTAGLINGVIKIGTTINDLKQKWTYASLNISLFSSSLTAVKAALQEISIWRNTAITQTQGSEQLDQDLEVCMESCAVLIAVVERKLKDIDLDNISKYEKARLVSWDTQFKDFSDHLGAQVRALQLLLTVHQCRTLSEQNEKLRRIQTRKAVSAVRESAASLDYEERDIEDAASILSEAPSQDFAFDNTIMQHHSYSRTYPKLFARMQENFPSTVDSMAQENTLQNNPVTGSSNHLVARNKKPSPAGALLIGQIKTICGSTSSPLANLDNFGYKSSPNDDDAATIRDIVITDTVVSVETVNGHAPDPDVAGPPVRRPKTLDESHKNSTPENGLILAQKNTPKAQKPQLSQDSLGSVLLHDSNNGASRAIARFGFARTRKWFGEATANPLKTLPACASTQIQHINYQPTNLCLPLREQIRRTRIADRLENSNDKTEFWMPALPWRCIDYLNYHAIAEIHIYAAPGSDRHLKMWWQKFDQERDIDLFNQEGPVDTEVIASLLKRWLRSLPDAILDQDIQRDLSTKYDAQKQAPEELRDILKKLAPWNYYLLFAITCHLSLLLVYEDTNKTSLRGLFLRVGPALRLNANCFSWLVRDWRRCWLGCETEKRALEDEYRILDQ